MYCTVEIYIYIHCLRLSKGCSTLLNRTCTCRCLYIYSCLQSVSTSLSEGKLNKYCLIHVYPFTTRVWHQLLRFMSWYARRSVTRRGVDLQFLTNPITVRCGPCSNIVPSRSVHSKILHHCQRRVTILSKDDHWRCTWRNGSSVGGRG